MNHLEIPLLCPNCQADLSSTNAHCDRCSWQAGSTNGGIPVFIKQDAAQNSITKSYSDNYNTIAKDDLVESIQDKSYLLVQSRKFLSYLGEIRGLKICEVGVGQGRLFEMIRASKPSQLTGVDIAVQYLEQISVSDNIELMIANAENLPFKNVFDVIIASDIVEHVMNVGDCMISLNRALRMGGRAVVKVPYRENLLQYAKQRGCKYEFVHLRTYNQPLLKDLMENSGFVVERFHYDGYITQNVRGYIKNSNFLAKRFSNYMKSKSIAEVADIPNWLGRILMRPVEITVVAKKITDIGH